MAGGTEERPRVLAARNAVAASFMLNGFCFASLVSRLPDIRSGLALDNGSLGLLLLCTAAGSVLALPATGYLVARYGPAVVVRSGAVLVAGGLVGVLAGAGPIGALPAAAAALFVYGVGTSVWDVAMNVEGADVERRLARTVMPRFHAGWSLGSVAGAVVGAVVTAVHVPMTVHGAGVAAVATAGVLVATGGFLVPEVVPAGVSGTSRSAWTEPRTLALGLMVLCFAVVEGSANDWLTLALVDGYDVPHWVGVSGYALFVTAMTSGRLAGTAVLDRFGRAPVLWATSATAAAGIVLVVVGGHAVLVALGIVVWGLGAALGFPVGISAAADDAARAPARVSVVATIGYVAFLAGPPLLGQLGDHVGTLEALLAVAVLMGPAAASVQATRRRPSPPG